MNDRKTLGRRGEDLIAQGLIRQGFSIEARNWTCRGGELDLVARRGSLLIFVEVRSISKPFLGSVLETITPKKRNSVSRAVMNYLARFPFEDGDIRIDVAAVNFFFEPPYVDYVENAFTPEEAI